MVSIMFVRLPWNAVTFTELNTQLYCTAHFILFSQVLNHSIFPLLIFVARLEIAVFSRSLVIRVEQSDRSVCVCVRTTSLELTT